MSTVSALRDLVKDAIDDISSVSVSNFSDARLLREVNRAALHTQDVVEQLDYTYFYESQDFNIAADGTSITLPTGFRKVIDLNRTDGDKNIRFYFKDVNERFVHDYVLENVYDRRKYFVELRKTTIEYRQAIGESHTVTLEYTKTLTETIEANVATDDYGFLPAAEELLVARAAHKVLTSENSPAQAAAANLYSLALQGVKDRLETRNVSTSRRVRYKG